MVYWFINFLFLFQPSYLFHFSFSSPPPSPSALSHSLSSSLFPVALLSSHSWIWATINFVSTITDLYPSSVFFFPLLFTLSSLFYRRRFGCGSSPLLYCLPVHEYEPPSISSLPSLIYILHRFFFPFCSLCPLYSIGVGLVVGLGCGCDFRLWVWLWVWFYFPIMISVGVGLWVVGSSSLFYIPVNWPSPFVSSESKLFESILGTRTLWVDFQFRERGPGDICARESRQE